MTGTLFNTAMIIIGSLLGAVIRKGIKDNYKNTIMQGMGLVAISLGITWIVKNMMTNQEPLLFIISIVLGAIIGEFLQLDQRMHRLGDKLSKKGKSNLVQGLTTTVVLFCMGTLSILGPIESALNGNHTMLYTNGMLDGVTSLIFASTFGVGIILTAPILFVWQGSIFLLAAFIEPYLTPEMMSQISLIGGILILSTGLNILEIVKIRTINLLPAILIVVLYYGLNISHYVSQMSALLGL